MEQLLLILVLILIGYFFGKHAESKHYRNIVARESLLSSLPCTTSKYPMKPEKTVLEATLVTGNVVISVDYFKRFLAGLRGLVGGRMSSYESLLDRARREAVLRLLESHPQADEFINLRLETFSISKGQTSNIGSVEVLAFGTAIVYQK